ncbi:MAG: hypothetical protein IJ642_06075 [Oscillospiraceae bacterium]|nr:hypothetical protein [Oscillospiraceae bacterium]
MIQKPEMTKKLAWIAFYLEAGWIAVNIILIFLACVLPVSGAYRMMNTEIPLSLPIVMAVGCCCMLPFAWSCLRSGLQKEISENQAVSDLVLPAVLYYIGIVLNWVMNLVTTQIAVRIYSADVLGAFSIKMQYQQVLNLLPVQTAAIVLVCCAAAVELYILKHKES